MSLGIEDAVRFQRARTIAKRIVVAVILLGFAVPYAEEAPRASVAAAGISLIDLAPPQGDVVVPQASCETPLGPTQADGEARGCCVLVTNEGPKCAYTNRGYCAMRAQEAGVQFEFHEVASCSELAQCR
jgi:hypothetical protein